MTTTRLFVCVPQNSSSYSISSAILRFASHFTVDSCATARSVNPVGKAAKLHKRKVSSTRRTNRLNHCSDQDKQRDNKHTGVHFQIFGGTTRLFVHVLQNPSSHSPRSAILRFASHYCNVDSYVAARSENPAGKATKLHDRRVSLIRRTNILNYRPDQDKRHGNEHTGAYHQQFGGTTRLCVHVAQNTSSYSLNSAILRFASQFPTADSCAGARSVHPTGKAAKLQCCKVSLNGRTNRLNF